MATTEEIVLAAANAADELREEALDYAEEIEDFANSRFTEFGFASLYPSAVSRVPPAPGMEELPPLKTSSIEYDLSGFDPNLYKQAVYMSPFFQFLEPMLVDFVENGGLAAGQDVQDAMFEQLRDRDLRALNDSLYQADKIGGRTGFPLPTSMLLASRNELIGKYQDLQADRSKEILVVIADRTQETVKMGVESGITMEKIQSDFSLGFAKLYIDMSLATITAYKTETDAFIAEFEGNLKALIAGVDVNLKNAELETTYQEMLMKQWEIELTANIEKVKAKMQDSMEGNKLRLSATQGAMSFYSNAVLGASSQVNAITSLSESVEG